jgi:hypothetical protein
MLKQEKVGGGADTFGDFSAALFFSALRGAGCNPLIRDGAIYTDLGGGYAARRWAAVHDLDGRRRLEYARAMWATRAPGATVVRLG